MNITQLDGLTGEVIEVAVTATELKEMFGDPVEALSYAEIEAQKKAILQSAEVKLAALGLTSDEIAALKS